MTKSVVANTLSQAQRVYVPQGVHLSPVFKNVVKKKFNNPRFRVWSYTHTDTQIQKINWEGRKLDGGKYRLHLFRFNLDLSFDNIYQRHCQYFSLGPTGESLSKIYCLINFYFKYGLGRLLRKEVVVTPVGVRPGRQVDRTEEGRSKQTSYGKRKVISIEDMTGDQEIEGETDQRQR